MVDFYKARHTTETIAQGVQEGNVFLACATDKAVGTGSILNGCEIGMVFVHPDFQGKGVGSSLMDFLERQIALDHALARLDAPVSAIPFYAGRTYVVVAHKTLRTPAWDCLYHAVMEKQLPGAAEGLSYNGRVFRTVSNEAHGEVSQETVFNYRQKGRLVWAEYSGGAIDRGFLIGSGNPDGSLRFSYQHVNREGAIRMGQCRSVPEILPDGRIRLAETWQWLDGDRQKGESVIEEVRA